MTEKDVRLFALEDFKLNPPSSSEMLAAKDEKINDDLGKKLAEAILESADAPEIEDPIFKTLAEPVLPAPPRENRARLQMQSPTRLHFYWSFRTNPFENITKIFGASWRNYSLAVRLSNETNGREEIYPVEAEGSWWFDVDADSTYRAEVGFYAARVASFARLLSSNSIETPRQNPSPRGAAAADWSVSANDFAEVLDASGYAQDAFEVALAGDDFSFAETATQSAFAQIFGETDRDVSKNNSSEMRFALLAIAAGYAPENLRGQISHSLYLRLSEEAANLTAERASAALQQNFGVFAGEEEEDAENYFLAPTVFGASLVNFPRASKRRFLPRLAPLSSF